MRPTISPKLSLTIAFFGAVLLAACSDNTAADDITADTTLGNVDVQQGTISDDNDHPRHAAIGSRSGRSVPTK